MSASQRSGKAGIQCLHEYPIFHFLFQLNDKRSLLSRATHDTSDLHNHTFPEQPSRQKNLARKFWKLGRVAYLPMKTDVDGDNLKSLNAPGFRGVAQGMLKYRDPHSS